MISHSVERCNRAGLTCLLVRDGHLPAMPSPHFTWEPPPGVQSPKASLIYLPDLPFSLQVLCKFMDLKDLFRRSLLDPDCEFFCSSMGPQSLAQGQHQDILGKCYKKRVFLD